MFIHILKSQFFMIINEEENTFSILLLDIVSKCIVSDDVSRML